MFTLGDAIESLCPNASKILFYKSYIRVIQVSHALAKGQAWWPDLDKMLEKQAFSCPS